MLAFGGYTQCTILVPYSINSFFRLVHVLLYDILGRYFGMKLIKIFKWEKNCFGPIRSSFSWFSSQNIVILSQNNVPKYGNKGHEQVFYHHFYLFTGTGINPTKWIPLRPPTFDHHLRPPSKSFFTNISTYSQVCTKRAARLTTVYSS